MLYNEIFITLRYFHIWFTLHFHWNLNLKTRVSNLLVLHLKHTVGLISLSGILFHDLWRYEVNTKELISSIWNSWDWHFIWDWKQTKSTALFWLFWLNDDGRRNVAKHRRRLAFSWIFIVSPQCLEIAKCHWKFCKTNYICHCLYLYRGTELCLSTETAEQIVIVSPSTMSTSTEWMNWMTHWQFCCTLLKDFKIW